MDDRKATVLFADVSGSTKLYETAGDQAAHGAIARVIASMARAVETDGGRVVKTIGDEVMALFPGPDAAASAAAAMHGAVDAMPAVGETRLALRIGFHSGPVIQRDNDVFGDTVNLASRLVDTAVKGQIITSEETALQLGPVFRNFIRKLYAIQVKGKAEEVPLCEIIWRQTADMTAFAGGGRPAAKAALPALRLKYHDKEVVRRRDVDSIVLGREEGCGLLVSDTQTSRQHCTIERRGDKWVLKDHSTNGTYVTAEGDSEILLQREEVILRKHGWIALGQPKASTEEIVEYFCD
jgi:adenylate cyclase